VNHHQRKVLHAIFAHPLNANLEMKDIVSVLNALGAEIDAKSKSRLGRHVEWPHDSPTHLQPKCTEGRGNADP
jgi:hypothetical protein